MIENKLLHFSSRQAFDEAKYNIAPSSIAFVDEGRTIYTHGVEYNALSGTGTELSQYVTYTYLQSILDGYVRNSTITLTVQTILDAMLPSWTTIVSKIETLEGNDGDIQQAIASIQALVDNWEALITLRALWEALSNGDKTSHIAEIFLWANEHDSGIRLSADRIDLDGVVSLLEAYIVDRIGQNPQDYSELQTAILNLQQWRNSMGYLTNSGIVFQNNDTDNFVAFTSATGTDPIGGLYHKHPSTGYSSYRLGNDGSGYLGLIEGSNGQHAIWWDTNGNLHFHNSITSQWGGGSGSSSASGQFYDQAFTMTSTNVAPAVPSDANAHPWPQGANDDTRIENGYDTGSAGEGNWARSVYDPVTYGIQEDSSKYVWMATRLYDIEDGTPIEESWNGPWLISGADGNPGEDGKGIEFVYTRTATNDASVVTSLSDSLRSKVANRDKTFLDEDFAPTGWYDNPQGVSAAYPYEWMGLRTSDGEGVWSDFSGPFLWSHYGQNGTDGDGVEYIFWAKADGTAPLQDPSLWPTDSTTPGKYDRIFQDDDYVGPTNSEWLDNPINLKGVSYGPGSVQYVSMRKKNGSTGLWGAFSEPAFWSNYAVDGIVEGYVVDLSNEVMPVVVDGDGNLTSTYTSNTEVSVFHNGLKEAATVVAGTPERSDDGSVSGITAVVTTSLVDSDDKTVTVTIPTTVTGIAGVNIRIPLTITLQDTTTRTVVITCFGVAAGDGKMSFNLQTDVSAIRRNIAGTVVDPSQIRVWLSTVESDGVHEYTAVNANQCPLPGTLTFEYAYDTGTYTTLSTEYIQSLQANHNQLVVRAKLNGTPIDIERIPYIKDGELGIPGTGSETYIIVPQFSSIAVNGNNKLNGTVAFNVYRQIGLGEREEITANPSYSRNIYVDVNGKNKTVSYSNGKWSTTVTNVDYDNTKTASVYIYIKTTTDTLLWSLVIPIPIKGDAGTGVSGDVTAFAFKRSTTQPSTPSGGTYANPTPTGWSDGIPSGTGSVWESTTIFHADNSNTGWSTPVEISSTESTDVEYSIVESNPGTPTTRPINWSTYSSIRNPEDIIWKAERRTTNGIVGSWEVYRIKGEKGDQGPAGATELQGFEGVVMRLSPYDNSTTYYDGTVPVDGVKYKDVVSYGTSSAGNTIYWTPNTSSVSGIIPSTQNSGSWKMFSMVNDSYIDTLISNNAYINNLTSKQVVITKKEDNKDKIVAGMIGGNSIPTEMQGTGNYTSNLSNSTGVRIFAGAVPSNGNIKNTAFTVTEAGTVKISPTGIANDVATFNSGNDAFTTDNASIILNNDGSGQLAKGAIKWDKDGNFIFKQDSGGFATNDSDSVANLMLVTEITTVNGNDNSSANLTWDSTFEVKGLLFKNGAVRKYINPCYVSVADLLILNKYSTDTNVWNTFENMLLIVLLNRGFFKFNSTTTNLFSDDDYVSIIVPAITQLGETIVSNDNDTPICKTQSVLYALKVKYQNMIQNRPIMSTGFLWRKIKWLKDNCNVQWKFCDNSTYDQNTRPDSPDVNSSIWRDYIWGVKSLINVTWIAIRTRNSSSDNWGTWQIKKATEEFTELS